MATKRTRRQTSALPEMSEARAAKRRRASGNDGVDRLSALPDALLHSVMSYLTAQQAVQTCALSRRWRDLWRSAPCLHVDSDMLDSKPAGAEHEQPAPVVGRTRWERLEGFTIKLLLSHGAPTLDTFRLHVSIAHHQISQHEDGGEENGGRLRRKVTAVREHVVRWILRGASYQPAALEISLMFVPAHVKLPPLGSTSRRLRTLRLAGVLLDGGFAEHLRTGCPVLEDLELRTCGFATDFKEVVSGTLKSLTIDDCFARQHPDEKWCVSVAAPCLASLTYRSIGTRRIWSSLKQIPLPTLAGLEPSLPRVVTASCELVLMLL